MPLLEILSLHKSYPDGWVLHDVSFSAAAGEVLGLLGPSGSGKTTLLRLIAGLEQPDGGQVRLDGQDVAGVPPHRRGFGLMFQEYALFPHKNIFENVAFGLRMAGWERGRITLRVAEVLALVGLEGFERRDVHRLSGGERQRVALARSLAPQPRLLMLDEPLGALDRTLRERLLDELPAILRRVGLTVLYVTHDQEEAFAIADTVLLLRAGRVVQSGPPEHVYRCPADAWAARFLGLTNLLPGSVMGVEPLRVQTGLGELQVGGTLGCPGSGPYRVGQPVTVLVRPEGVELGGAGALNRVRGVVTERLFRGRSYRLQVRHAGGVELAVEVGSDVFAPEPTADVVLTLRPDALAALEPDLAGST